MPTLSCFFAIYTDGTKLNESFIAPPGADVFLGEMGAMTMPGPQDELFGPHLSAFQRFKPRRAYLLGFRRSGGGKAEQFFYQVREAFLAATSGARGFALDVLRLFPFPLESAADVLPDQLLAEDLFSVGFVDMGEHGVRAETVGFSKLGQRELTFEFADPTLMEEAALLCGHLADWLLAHNRRIEPNAFMSFGFDRLTFFAAEGEAGGPFRGWHPPLVQRLVPAQLFEGVGVLEVRASPPGDPSHFVDLTIPLRRSQEQRAVLEELDLTGDSPHASTTAHVRGWLSELKDVVAVREESTSSKDSGWRFRGPGESDSGESGVLTLFELASKAPELVRYLALPHGVKLSWGPRGGLEIDASRVEVDEEEADDALS